jgi:23S rRNA (guanine2445-N2)-methyltransferase / 23S rRNA (guanine2069-N7)-methyltransferase
MRADAVSYLAEAASDASARFDVVFLDPPSFSTSKGMDGTLDVQRDHIALITASARVLAPGGTLVFSTNLRKFKLDEDALAEARLVAEDVTAATIPPDFERNRRIHHCYVVKPVPAV